MRECFNCDKKFSRPDYYQGKVLCPLCGTVLDEDNFTEEPTFVKTASGQSQLSGNFVKSVLIRSGISQRTYDEASDGIKHMMNALGIDGGDSLAKPALRLFTLLVERNFTRGRTKELVQASCLYISCRVSLKPYLLIDFSEFLRINVYVLGAVFLQICKTLSLVEHDFVQKPVDPSLFIHRFTDRLFNGKNHQVSFTALRIIASMKRDWMQTGRKPSGLCGAALYISSLSHGLKCSKSDIIKVVHVCEATLTKRLIEFENTESGSLTIEEFMMKSKELEEEEQRNQLRSRASGSSEFLCKHDDSGEPPFAHGLCRDCYDDFIKISGGLGGGLEPPAFQRAQRKRIMAKEAAVRHGSSTFSAFQHSNKQLNSDEQRSTENMTHGKAMQLIEMNVPGCTLQNKEVGDDEMVEDSETLSDVDDVEVDVYLHTEEEKQLKKIVWEEMNKEYLEEQAKKEADAKAAREAYEAKIANCSEDALELAAAAAAAVAKSKKTVSYMRRVTNKHKLPLTSPKVLKRHAQIMHRLTEKKKRAADAKASGPPGTPAEATKQMLSKKRFSSKINFDAVDALYDEESENIDTNKKMRIEAEAEHEDNYFDNNSKDYLEFEGDFEEYPYIDNMQEYDYDDDYSNF